MSRLRVSELQIRLIKYNAQRMNDHLLAKPAYYGWIAILVLLMARPAHAEKTPTPLMMPDTTREACGTTETYNRWIDNERFELALAYPDDSLVVTPPVFNNFSFPTPCNDTVSHLLEVFDEDDNLLFSKTAVLIVRDTSPPTFSSPFPDTIYLSCNDTIPAPSTVTISDNCQLGGTTYFQRRFSGGSCPVTDTLNRTWEAEDICGNQSSYRQVIIIADMDRPVFTSLPPLVDTVTCTADAHPDFTGYPTAFDTCDAEPTIEYLDQVQNNADDPACDHQKRITRVWLISDDCSNTNTYVQTIYVIDTIPPVFTAPGDTTISCAFGDDPAFTGVPIFEQSDCDSLTADNYRFADQVSSGDCTHRYSVRRTWFVFDNCGNEVSFQQNIEVVDTTGPDFQPEASDLILNCTLGLDLEAAFSDWVDARGGAVAQDNCSPDSLLSWQALVAGTGSPASFPMRSCRDGDQIILEQVVDFVATDECGKADTTRATFRVIDDIAPVMGACPGDTTIYTRTQDCLAELRLVAPPMSDQCSIDSLDFPGLRFGYRINEDSLVIVAGNEADIALPIGTHEITYYAIDCAGNRDSCSFLAEVLDNVPPVVNCPAPVSLRVAEDSCTVLFQLPLPAASDNCALDTSFTGPRPIYYVTGATAIMPTKMTSPASPPVIEFAQGISEVAYVVQDSSGNRDTCSFQVEVIDDIVPVARCQPTTLFINPSGLEVETVDVGDIDAGSTDNCGVDSLYLTPSLFNCEQQVGSVQDIVLTVLDASGNMDRCTTFVRIENLEPQPSANSGLCGNDTLFLSANPPPADGGTVYTYRWTGPNGFTSTRENPFIPNISPVNAGSYTVEITGLTGCTSLGSVEVAIEDLPLRPELIAEDNYCINSVVNLASSVAPDAGQVTYRWYRGSPPNGQLLAETVVPAYSFPAPSVQGSDEYYVTVEADGCLSQPSTPKRITINEFPVAIPEQATITVCSGEAIALGTPVIGEGLTYRWTGPNGYDETGQFPRTIEEAGMANDGIYTLVVSRNGCASEPAFVRVNVIPRPDQPMLSNNGPICEGERIVLRTNADATIYHWVAPDLTEFSTMADSFVIDQATRASNGPWRLFVTDFECDSELSAPSEMVVNVRPNTLASQSSDIVCEGSDLILSASPNIANAVYEWSGPNGFSALGRNVNLQNISANRSGNYTVTITTKEGCSSGAQTTVDVRASVQIVAATNDGPACLSGPTDIRLDAAVFPADDGRYMYAWTGPNGFISNVKEALIPNATAANNGNYQLIVTNGDGCVSTPALTTVDVSDPPLRPQRPVVSDITPAPFCVGAPIILTVNDYTGTQVSYRWQLPNGGLEVTSEPRLEISAAAVTDGGDYRVVVNVNGCNSNPSEILRINVQERPAAIINTNSPVCAGDQIQFQANFVANATYRWVGPNFSSSVQNPTILEADSAMHAGNYELIIERAGCPSVPAMATVTVEPTPAQPQLLGNTVLCGSDTNAVLRIDLAPASQTANAFYSWSGPNGTLATTTDPFLELRNLANFPDGPNNFTAVAQLGNCPSDFSAPLTVTINQIPEYNAFAGQDFAVCETDEVFLRAEAPPLGTGRWSLISPDTISGVIISNPANPMTSVNGLTGDRDYVFRWSLSNGACQNYSTDEIQVSVNKFVDARAGDDQIACANQVVQLDALPVGSGSGFWTQPEAQSLFGVRIQDATDPKSTITGLRPGNLYSFTWNVMGSCGNESDEVLILISDPSPFAGIDQVVCNDQGFAGLNADEPADGSIGTWIALDSTVRISSLQSPDAVVTNLQPGRYQFVWEMDNGICGPASRDTVEILFKNNPVTQPESYAVEFGEPLDFNVLENDEAPPESFVNIVDPPNNGTLEDLGNGRFIFQPSFDYAGTDRFFYELCSEGCECALEEVEFNIGANAGCEIPSVFTPNNDGVNDFFVVPCLFNSTVYPNSQLIIINRWGDEVYRSSRPYQNDWQGRFNGEDLPVGTYFYILDYGNGEEPVSSFFMIQR